MIFFGFRDGNDSGSFQESGKCVNLWIRLIMLVGAVTVFVGSSRGLGSECCQRLELCSSSRI